MNNNRIDHGLSHVVPPNKTIFNAETYVGNWYEQTVQNTLKMKDFINKRECEELSIQKSQVMADILLKPVRLTERRDGFVYFGDSVQIISPGPDCATALADYPFKKYCENGHLALSASVPPTVIDHSPYLNTDSIITASKHLYPVVRNSFVIENPDCPTDNSSILRYGDVFRIRAMPTQHWALCLHSAPAIPLHAASVFSAKPLVRFSDTKNPNTLWKLISLDAMDNLKIELGIPVPLKKRMVLQHALSGNNLSIEPEYPVLTYFGCESEVTVHTKRNRVRKVTWANHWFIDTERGWTKPDPEVVAQAKFSAKINVNDINKSASEEEREKEKQRREEEGEDEEDCEGREVRFDPDTGKLNVGRSGMASVETPGACYNPSMSLAAQAGTEAGAEKTGESCEQTVEQFERDQLEREFVKMRIDRSVPGQTLPYDWRTAPQPHAHQYRLRENREFYPNMKWNCGDTQCCYNRNAIQQKMEDCPRHQPKCYDQHYNPKK